jgi:ketosteroid isomerase-like protein
MSQENVEIVRAAIDGYNQTGELPWDLIDPEVEWVIDPSGNLAGHYRGHDGVRVYLKQLHDALDRVRLEIDEVVDAGDCVVALGRMRVHGKRSDITVEQPMSLLCRVRDGQIVTLRSYIRIAKPSKPPGWASRPRDPTETRVSSTCLQLAPITAEVDHPPERLGHG